MAWTDNTIPLDGVDFPRLLHAGPGAGKSTLVRALWIRGYVVFDSDWLLPSWPLTYSPALRQPANWWRKADPWILDLDDFLTAYVIRAVLSLDDRMIVVTNRYGLILDTLVDWGYNGPIPSFFLEEGAEIVKAIEARDDGQVTRLDSKMAQSWIKGWKEYKGVNLKKTVLRAPNDRIFKRLVSRAGWDDNFDKAPSIVDIAAMWKTDRPWLPEFTDVEGLYEKAAKAREMIGESLTPKGNGGEPEAEALGVVSEIAGMSQ